MQRDLLGGEGAPAGAERCREQNVVEGGDTPGVPPPQAELPTPGCSRPGCPSALGGHSCASILSLEPTSHRDQLRSRRHVPGAGPRGHRFNSAARQEPLPRKSSRPTQCPARLVTPSCATQPSSGGRPCSLPTHWSTPSPDDCPGPWRAALCPPPPRGQVPVLRCGGCRGQDGREGGSGQQGPPEWCWLEAATPRSRDGLSEPPPLLGSRLPEGRLGEGATAITVTVMATAQATLGAFPCQALVPPTL